MHTMSYHEDPELNAPQLSASGRADEMSLCILLLARGLLQLHASLLQLCLSTKHEPKEECREMGQCE